MEPKNLLLLFFTCFVLVKCETCVQPKITNDGKTLDEGSTNIILIDKPQHLMCSLDGKSVANYTLKCDGEPEKTATQADDVKLSFTPKQAKQRNKCVCIVSKTGCEDKNTTVFFFNRLYEVTVGPNTSILFDLCPGSPDSYSIDCVLHTVMNPTPNMNLTLCGQNRMPVETVTNTSSITYTFEIEKKGLNFYQSCMCIAMTDKDALGFAGFSIGVIKPPSPPTLQVNNQEITGDFFKASMEEYYWIYCSYPDGQPDVSEVQLACGSQNVTSKDIQAKLDITKQKTSENVTCTCSATHQSNCVNATTFTVMLPSLATFPELSVLVSVMAAFVALWAQA